MRRIIAIILLIILAACSNPEKDAQRAAENYMDAVKMGDEYNDHIKTGTEGFIDVFDYEYLQTLDAPKEKKTVSTTYEFYNDVFSDRYKTFAEFKETEKEIYDDYEILRDDDTVIEFWDGESYKDIHKFLYNVEIANGLGEKIYKKAEIEVEMWFDFDEDDERIDMYKVRDIYLR